MSEGTGPSGDLSNLPFFSNIYEGESKMVTALYFLTGGLLTFSIVAYLAFCLDLSAQIDDGNIAVKYPAQKTK